MKLIRFLKQYLNRNQLRMEFEAGLRRAGL